MKNLFFLFVGLTVAMFAATDAEARRGAVPSYVVQELAFVAPTKIPGESGNLSLCVLTETKSVIFKGVNYWRSAEKYALAGSGCNTESYMDFGAEKMALAKTMGLIDAGVPDEPGLGLGQVFGGFWALMLVAVPVGFVLLGKLAMSRRRRQQRAVMGTSNPAALAVLEAMCFAAMADGEVAEEELMEIKAAAEAMTGESYDMETLSKMASMADPDPKDEVVTRMVQEAPLSAHELMMRGVLYVISADGRVVEREWNFVTKLATVMKMSGDKLRLIVAETAAIRA